MQTFEIVNLENVIQSLYRELSSTLVGRFIEEVLNWADAK